MASGEEVKLLDGFEIDEIIKRMREVQKDERLSLVVRVNALKIETCLLQMDIDLLQEGMEKHGQSQNLRNPS